MTPNTTRIADAPVCRKCGVELTDENWYPSYRKRNTRICRRCNSIQTGHRPFGETPNCSHFLGIHVAERVLSHVFKDVMRMPHNNPGYDFVCNKGKKIDVKSACMRGAGGWAFDIRRNTTADYFLCLAFDNREDLTPLHVWLIPGSKFNRFKNASISISTINKWDEYQLDLSRISECCDTLRGTANNKIPTVATRPPVVRHNPSRLSILSYLAAGLNPAKIAVKLNVPAGTLQYHLSILKRQGLIRKIGYGTWEVLKSSDSEKKTTAGSSHVGTPQHPPSRGSPAVLTQAQLTQFQQDAVRAHAFVFTLSVPHNLRHWNNEKRTQYLTAHQIPYKPLNIGGGGQRIIVKDRKTWLTNRSIIIYDKASYFAEGALQAKSTALATHLSIIKHIERLLHTSFEIGSDYKFRVSRQHYALIQNALARQYNDADEKLEVRNGKGLWFLIDNSYNMNEAETVHPSTGMTDNQKVQGFFNGLKDIPSAQGAPSYTPGFVLEMMTGIQANQLMFAENIDSHISAIKDLGAGVRDMTTAIQKLEQQK